MKSLVDRMAIAGSARVGAGSAMRRIVVMIVLSAVLVAGVARSSSASSQTGPTGARTGAESVSPPGLRPEVQRWFAARDKALIRFNDALVAIVQNKVTAADANAACRKIDSAVQALNAVGAAPDAKVKQLVGAGMPKIGSGIAACLAGDLTTARRLISEGLAERADASLALDEVLEGEPETSAPG
jgi:hypothetical protein